MTVHSDFVVASWNVNGLRSCLQKGFLQWLAHSSADVVLLQETRSFAQQIPPDAARPNGYNLHLFPARKAGYSGVGIYSRIHPSQQEIREGLGFPEFDEEGRWLELELKEKKLVLISAYFPNSQRLGARLDYKLRFCDAALARLRAICQSGKDLVLGGDFNIAHEERDLANPKTNQKNAGFLPEERSWFGALISDGFIDSFRKFTPEGGHYTWWSQRPGVRERNIGWRIDYHVTSPNLEPSLIQSRIEADQLGSDHCPIALHLNL